MEKQLDIITDSIKKFTIKDVINNLGLYYSTYSDGDFFINDDYKLESGQNIICLNLLGDDMILEFRVKKLSELGMSKQEIAELIQESVFRVSGIKINTGY